MKNSQFLETNVSVGQVCSLFYSSLQIFFFFRASGKFSRTGSFPSGLVLEVELIGSFNT